MIQRMAVTWLRHWRKKFFFLAAERSFCEILRRIAPDCIVFAKVRLCDFVSVSKERNNWPAHHNLIQSKPLDFLVCDATLAPLMAVELEDSSSARSNRKVRDEFVAAALAAARVPIVRIPIERSYVFEEIRQLIFRHLHDLAPVC